jgi:hypothetical protein
MTEVDDIAVTCDERQCRLEDGVLSAESLVVAADHVNRVAVVAPSPTGSARTARSVGALSSRGRGGRSRPNVSGCTLRTHRYRLDHGTPSSILTARNDLRSGPVPHCASSAIRTARSTNSGVYDLNDFRSAIPAPRIHRVLTRHAAGLVLPTPLPNRCPGIEASRCEGNGVGRLISRG